MKSTVILKFDAKDCRVSMIRELRKVTGCSLKEAVDLISSNAKKGDEIQVSLIPVHISVMDFFEKKDVFSDQFKAILVDCIDSRRYDLARDILSLMLVNNL